MESYIQEFTWEQIRADVKAVNPMLTGIIDKISPNKKYTLFKITYSFGDLIVKNGLFQIPLTKYQLQSLAHAEVDSKLKDALSYSPIPLFLTMRNCHEVFLDTGSRAIPLNLFNEGSLLGLFETVDYLFNRNTIPRWCVSAGVRSLFMLPKISEMQGLKRLYRQYGLNASEARLGDFSDHWHLFKSIATHPSFTQQWQSEIIVFSKAWLNNNDAAWSEFRRCLFQSAWHQSQFAMSKIELSFLWETFLNAVSSRRLKLTPYLVDQVKHILLIASGQSPGFRPANGFQQAAPCQGLQEAILSVYMLKHYFPTFMYPCLLNPSMKVPVYYSLMFPTLLEGLSHKKSSSTVMLDLQSVNILLNILLESISQSRVGSDGNLKNIAFKCFHVECDQQQKIYSSKLIPELDYEFLQEKARFPERDFCASSSFWRGSIRIGCDELVSL